MTRLTQKQSVIVGQADTVLLLEPGNLEFGESWAELIPMRLRPGDAEAGVGGLHLLQKAFQPRYVIQCHQGRMMVRFFRTRSGIVV